MNKGSIVRDDNTSSHLSLLTQNDVGIVILMLTLVAHIHNMYRMVRSKKVVVRPIAYDGEECDQMAA